MNASTNETTNAGEGIARPRRELLDKFRDAILVKKLLGNPEVDPIPNIVAQLFKEIDALTEENEAMASARRDTEPAPSNPHIDDELEGAADVEPEVTCDQVRAHIELEVDRGETFRLLNRFIDQAERWLIELRDLEKHVVRMRAAGTIAEFDSLLAALDAAEKAGAACHDATRGGAKS